MQRLHMFWQTYHSNPYMGVWMLLYTYRHYLDHTYHSTMTYYITYTTPYRHTECIKCNMYGRPDMTLIMCSFNYFEWCIYNRWHPNETTTDIAHNDASRDVDNHSGTAEIMSNDTGSLDHEVQTEMTCQTISELEFGNRARVADYTC